MSCIANPRFVVFFFSSHKRNININTYSTRSCTSLPVRLQLSVYVVRELSHSVVIDPTVVPPYPFLSLYPQEGLVPHSNGVDCNIVIKPQAYPIVSHFSKNKSCLRSGLASVPGRAAGIGSRERSVPHTLSRSNERQDPRV